ncbi:single-stranded-DNA-specific exonuclease RecJ [Eggerthellaceae bacterium zg-1084]|uniref:single-stranded-DNA-specific exonuclease RecJ n=1 Tax=Berryella wangjianweii TaxID=2734634 RepID=UPI0015519CCB|nr:single-stranded-DNA-specific exonuclease RecJ [Berryella wangjianweii]NPD30684.1 single-stranded-DNA-specific exonuclease RecJ [Berryella wangjianweii]
MPAQFNVRRADEAAVSSLQERFDLPRFVATTLVSRGFGAPEDAERFLTPSLERDWLDPYAIPGMREVVDAMERALREHRHIVVFGDFDVDGVSATALLTRALRALGGHVTPFIPRRFDEGYAITEASYQRVRQLDPELIVTVDCGVSCRDLVAQIAADGIEVAITDHHEPGDQVPEGVPVTDPKLDPACPSGILAGAGVALKAVQALGGRFGYPDLWRAYTDLATLGTVADLMPMRDENRALVRDGLDRMNHGMRPCLAALLGQAGASGKAVSSTNIGYSMVPRLNAAGRMGDADVALRLLLSDSFDESCQLAAELEAVNDKRRAIEAELSEVAKLKAAEVYRGQRALVVAGEGWHEGVKGIVASRLASSYGVPCLLFSIENGEARGSGRTVGQVNLYKAVESAEDLLTRFGGHEAAVGVTLPADRLDELARRLCAYMDDLSEDLFHPLISIDAAVSMEELTLDGVAQLDRLAPFGQENRVPTLLARDVVLGSRRAVGADKSHFSCTLSDGTGRVAGIMFHCTSIDSLMYTDAVVTAAFEVQVDEWRGRRSVKAMLKSLAPAQTCRALEACLDPQNVSFVADLFATSDEELCASVPESPDDAEAAEADRADRRQTWERRARLQPERFEVDLLQALIGAAQPHESQRRVLDLLAQGQSVMAVMATGRGKSLTFQVHAVRRALRDGKASLFVYPLRALISDQAFHLRNMLAAYGIAVSVLTGESSPDQRRAVYEALERGTCDIVLTTPEFLEFHVDQLAASGRVDFAVIDEAHHVGLAGEAQRPAYARVGESLRALGCGQVLALTATADGPVAQRVAEALSLDAFVFDRAVRPNLQVHDRRGTRDRDDYLANLIAGGTKTVVYVPTREQSISLARELRRRVPQMALLIGFYNGGLARAERQRIEHLFRTGSLAVLVATSAFGEGVNIPDIGNVVLYGMPYNDIEFNQMSGRAGRDGREAGIHLLFGRSDASANEAILAGMTPDRDRLALLYRHLRDRQRDAGDATFTISCTQVAEGLSAAGERSVLTPATVAGAVAIFRELGLVEARSSHADAADALWVRVHESADKVDLADSVRFREGQSERSAFDAYRGKVLRMSATQIEDQVRSPIVPPCAHDASAGGGEGADTVVMSSLS